MATQPEIPDDVEETNGQIDDDVVDLLKGIDSEAELMGQYVTEGSSENQSIDFVAQWFPDEDEWQGKTQVTWEQAQAMAVLRHLPKAYPELEGMEDFLDGVIRDYEMYLTSVEGESRDQQRRILESLFGEASERTEEFASSLTNAFGGGSSGDD